MVSKYKSRVAPTGPKAKPKVDQDIEQFLAQGGEIQTVPPGATGESSKTRLLNGLGDRRG